MVNSLVDSLKSAVRSVQINLIDWYRMERWTAHRVHMCLQVLNCRITYKISIDSYAHWPDLMDIEQKIFIFFFSFLFFDYRKKLMAPIESEHSTLDAQLLIYWVQRHTFLEVMSIWIAFFGIYYYSFIDEPVRCTFFFSFDHFDTFSLTSYIH